MEERDKICLRSEAVIEPIPSVIHQESGVRTSHPETSSLRTAEKIIN